MPYRVLDPATAAVAPVYTGGAPLVSVGETLLSLRSELNLQLGNRTETGIDARLNSWINWAYRHTCGMLKLKRLKGSLGLSLVADQPFYLLPVQVRSVRSMSVIDSTNYSRGGRPLELIDEAMYNKLEDRSAEPRAYFPFGNMVVVWPDPTNARTAPINFWINPDDLTQDTHSPIIAPVFHEVILLFARHRAFRSLRNYKEAMAAKNDALMELRTLRDPSAEEQENLHGQIAVPRSVKDLRSVTLTVEPGE